MESELATPRFIKHIKNNPKNSGYQHVLKNNLSPFRGLSFPRMGQSVSIKENDNDTKDLENKREITEESSQGNDDSFFNNPKKSINQITATTF